MIVLPYNTGVNMNDYLKFYYFNRRVVDRFFLIKLELGLATIFKKLFFITTFILSLISLILLISSEFFSLPKPLFSGAGSALMLFWGLAFFALEWCKTDAINHYYDKFSLNFKSQKHVRFYRYLIFKDLSVNHNLYHATPVKKALDRLEIELQDSKPESIYKNNPALIIFATTLITIILKILDKDPPFLVPLIVIVGLLFLFFTAYIKSDSDEKKILLQLKRHLNLMQHELQQNNQSQTSTLPCLDLENMIAK